MLARLVSMEKQSKRKQTRLFPAKKVSNLGENTQENNQMIIELFP